MLSKLLSAAVQGIDGHLITVEVDLAPGLPTFTTVGLPDAAVRESKDRVAAALRNSGFDAPVRRVTVNLSPADVKKEGTAFDLPIALGILAADGVLSSNLWPRFLIVGELTLEGRVRPVRGLLSMALAARDRGMEGIIFPEANGAEAALVGGLKLVPVSDLRQAVDFMRGNWTPEAPRPLESPAPDAVSDFSDIKGQLFAKRAIEAAAAGGHNLLMIGPPGSGKTMLAKRLPGILPALGFEESIETTRVHSVAGQLRRGQSRVTERPFRSPHHTISDVALVGGGSIPRPGEVSLAHNGVLFLDELPEFDRHVLEVLRQPLEDGFVNVARAATSVTFPSRFMLVAAMNPCPCGFHGHPERECFCTPFQVQKYRAKISGPLLDRIDLQVEVPALRVSELTNDGAPGESSKNIAARVSAARGRQRERFGPKGSSCNTQMGPKEVKAHCGLDGGSKTLLKNAVARLGLSARSYDRILKVARTLADLAGAGRISQEHVAEAIGYRCLDRPLTELV